VLQPSGCTLPRDLRPPGAQRRDLVLAGDLYQQARSDTPVPPKTLDNSVTSTKRQVSDKVAGNYEAERKGERESERRERL
jgi:hypothetical protein